MRLHVNVKLMEVLHADRCRTLGELIRAADAEELSLPAGLDVAQTSRSFALAARRLEGAGVAASAPAYGFWVPGRVEVAGKHTDYAGGRSLLCAVTRGFYAVSAERDDALFRVHVSFGLSGAQADATLQLHPEPAPSGEAEASGAAVQEWVKYPAAVARRLTRNWGPLLGVELALECDLPEDSGLSSSSAMITLSFLALATRNRLASRPAFPSLLPTDERLCHYLGCIENGHDCGPELPGAQGVGTFGGSEDHTAIVCCRQSELRQYSFCPTRLEATVAFPDGLRLIIAVSGAVARKGGERMEDYNNAALLAGWAAEAAAAGGAGEWAHLIPEGGGGAAGQDVAAVAGGRAAAEGAPPRAASAASAASAIGTVPHVAPSVAAAGGEEGGGGDGRHTLASVLLRLSEQMGLPPRSGLVADEAERRLTRAHNGARPSGCPASALASRLRQFHEESEVLVPGIASAFSRNDHSALSTLVARSHALTCTHLCNTVPETEWLPPAGIELGAIAASAFGAGFGGSCWAVAPTDLAAEIADRWRQLYVQRFPEREQAAKFFVMAPGPGACAV